MIELCSQNSWYYTETEQKTIFVISPGAGTARNRKAYECLEKNFNVIYFAQSGGEYDKYPLLWENNSFVEARGKHLGGIAELVEHKIYTEKVIPSIIIAGSRGGQVTIGKIWERIWRGPTIIINAGVLTSRTMIPDNMPILFIIMEKDYFKSVNTPQKVQNLIKMNSNQNPITNIIYLKDHYHMPNLNQNLVSLLTYSSLLLLNRVKKIPLDIEFI